MNLSTKRFNYVVKIIPFFALMCCVSGCVKEFTNEEGIHHFQHELWVPVSWFAGGVAALFMGVPIMRFVRKLGVLFVICGFVSVTIIAPQSLMNHVSIGDDHFDYRTGVWCTKAHRIEYADLTQARYIVTKTVDSDGDVRIKKTLVCEFRDGREAKFTVANRVNEAAVSTVISHLSDSGVPVLDETSGLADFPAKGTTDSRSRAL